MIPFRIGHGFDLHRLEDGLPLVVAGVSLDYDKGCVAHSDGDVVAHALVDALMGAVGQQDIGQLFPDDDPRWKGADSSLFVKEAVSRLMSLGWQIGNVDVTVILQQPKLGPHKPAMRACLAQWLQLDESQVNLKAKTHENVDALGESRAIACHVVALVARSESQSECSS